MLDTVALKTVQRLIGQLVVKDQTLIPDLVAGWNSPLPAGMNAAIVGLWSSSLP